MKIAKDVFSYLVIEIISKSIPFALLPFLTRALEPAEYAVIISFTAISAFFNIIVGLNCQSGIATLYFKDKGNYWLYIKVAWSFWLLSALLIMFISVFVYFLGNIDGFVLISALLFSLAWFPVALYTTLLRLKGQLFSYGKFVVFEIIFNVSLTAILVQNIGAEGRVISIVLSMAIFGLVASLFLFKIYVKKKLENAPTKKLIHKSKRRRVLNICLPVLPHLMSGWIRSGLDRNIVGIFFGASILGLYGVGSQLAMVMGVISSSVTLAIGPFVNSQLAGGGQKQKLVLITYVISLLLLLTGVVYIYFCKYFAHLIIGSDFIRSLEILPYFVISFCFQGISNLFVVYIYYAENTKLLLKLAFPVGIMFAFIQYVVALNFDFYVFKWLIVVQSLLYMLLIMHISSKSFKMPWFDLKGALFT